MAMMAKESVINGIRWTGVVVEIKVGTQWYYFSEQCVDGTHPELTPEAYLQQCKALPDVNAANLRLATYSPRGHQEVR